METKDCPKCGKKMIKWFRGHGMRCDQPIDAWDWRCGCGNMEAGDIGYSGCGDNFVEEWMRINMEII